MAQQQSAIVDQTDPSVTPAESPGQLTVNETGQITSEQPKDTVRFNGLNVATRRVIRVNGWGPKITAKGGQKAKDAVWDLSNGYTLPKDDFNEEQLKVLEADGMFSIK